MTETHINESHYRALFEQTNDGVFIISLDLKYLAVNKQAADMLGYEVDELVGMSVKEVVALEQRKGGHNGLSSNDVGENQPIYERIVRRKDDTTFPVEISTSIVYDSDGIPLHIQSIVRDITERKEFERELRQSEARNRAIVDALPDLVIRMKKSGEILDFIANDKHPLFEPLNQVEGKCIHDIWPLATSDLMKDNIVKAIETNAQKVFETKFENVENIYETRLDRIDENEVLAIIRDVSARAKLEQMKTDFINRASHELRTPLTTAILMTDLIRDGGTEEELEEFWQILIKELKRQKLLIDRFLMAGRLESNKLVVKAVPLNLLPIIEESIAAVNPLAKTKKIEIETYIPASLPNIYGDEAAIQQVFINLINNAVKYSPDCSTVTIKIESDLKWISVKLSDQGLGIPEEDLPYLFGRFFRARNVSIAEIPGSGIGLYLVRSIIDELGGDIEVTSKLGEGTTFDVRLKTEQGFFDG
jgi:PAS domain S-box-containing protein